MTTLDKRLEKLELKISGKVAYVWDDGHQSLEELNAKLKRLKVNGATKVFVCRWLNFAEQRREEALRRSDGE